MNGQFIPATQQEYDAQFGQINQNQFNPFMPPSITATMGRQDFVQQGTIQSPETAAITNEQKVMQAQGDDVPMLGDMPYIQKGNQLGVQRGKSFFPYNASTASGHPLNTATNTVFNAYDLMANTKNKVVNPFASEVALMQSQNAASFLNNLSNKPTAPVATTQTQVTVPTTTATEVIPTPTAEQAGGGNWLTNMFNKPSVEVPTAENVSKAVEKGPGLFKQSKDFFGSDKGQATSAIAGAGVGLISGLAKAGMQDKYDPRVGMSKPNLGGNLFGDATFTQVGLNPALMAATGGISALVGGGVDLIKNAVKYAKQKDRYENKKLATDTMQSIDDARENMKPDYTGYARNGTQVNPYLMAQYGTSAYIPGTDYNVTQSRPPFKKKDSDLENAMSSFNNMTTNDGLDEKGNYIYYDNPSGKGNIDADLGNAGLALMELTGIPSLYRVAKDPVGHLQSGLRLMHKQPGTGLPIYSTPEDLSKALDVVGAAATVMPLAKPVASGVNQASKTTGKFLNKLEPTYMSLDAPKGNMYGQNQVLIQQSRLLNPKIKEKYFKHQAPPSGPKKDIFEKMPSDYNNRITRENYEDFVNNIHGSTDYSLAKNFNKQPGNLGTGNYGKPGAVFSDAPLNNLEKDIINAHEKNHGIFAGTLSKEMKSDLTKPFGTNRPVPYYPDKLQADEVLARMAQFKNAVGIGDNQVFTLGHLNLIRKNYAKSFTDNSITEMLSKIKPGSIGEKQFLKNMNKYAFGIGVPATIATGIGMSSLENK